MQIIVHTRTHTRVTLVVLDRRLLLICAIYAVLFCGRRRRRRQPCCIRVARLFEGFVVLRHVLLPT